MRSEPFPPSSSAWTGNQEVGHEELAGEGRTLYRYVWAPGATETMTLWLYNQGRIPITVTGVETGTDSLFSFVAVRLTNDQFPTEFSKAAPFRAFTLGHDDQRGVTLLGRYGRCLGFGPNTSVGLESIKVHYRILGIARTQSVPLPGIFEFDVPAGGCPTG